MVYLTGSHGKKPSQRWKQHDQVLLERHSWSRSRVYHISILLTDRMELILSPSPLIKVQLFF